MPPKRVTKPLQSPRAVPLVAPSWDHWYLSFYSSYLDPVSSISFKGFSKIGFGPSLETRSRPFLRASPRHQKKGTLGPSTILCFRPRAVAPTHHEVAKEIWCPFPPSFYDFRVWSEGVLGPRKEHNDLKGPC